MRPIRIAVTTGDTDGIGLEIAAKALQKIGPVSGIQFILWRSPSASKRELSRLDSKFRRRTVPSWHSFIASPPGDKRDLVDIASSLSPAKWVELAAQGATDGHLDGIATAPISKGVIAAAGMNDLGHTDILKRVSGAKAVFMGFLGSKLNVVLATGHIPLSRVPIELDEATLVQAIRAANLLRSLLPKSRAKKPIGVLGINPHAGEDGLIGKEELSVHSSAISDAKSHGLDVVGPLSGDSAFFQEPLQRYSVFVAAYHDQGLIPFKALHVADSNVHISLGLPFVRTSVDHGTAKDIFGKNKADPKSMIKALQLAIELTRAHKDLRLERRRKQEV